MLRDTKNNTKYRQYVQTVKIFGKANYLKVIIQLKLWLITNAYQFEKQSEIMNIGSGIYGQINQCY